MDTLLFEFPAKADYLLSVRLLASSVGARMQMDIDEIEDLKSGSAEACLLLMGGFERIVCRFEINQDALGALFTGTGPANAAPPSSPEEAEMSRYMLEALMEDVTVSGDARGAVSSVSFSLNPGRRRQE